MQRGPLIAIAVVSCSLVGLGYNALDMAQRTRQHAFTEHGSIRLAQASNLSRDLAHEVDEIVDALKFLAGLPPSITAAERERAASALLVSAKAFIYLARYTPDGRLAFAARDPFLAPELSLAPFEDMMRAGARGALVPGAPEVVVSREGTTRGQESYRTFALRIPEAGDVLVMLVDTRRFTVNASRSARDLVLLDPHGLPSAGGWKGLPTARRYAAGGQDRWASPSFRAVLAEMRAGESGVATFPASDAVALGFPDAPVLVAHAQAASRAGRWSVAVLASTVGIVDRGRAHVAQLFLTSGAIGGCLIAFGVYVLVASRRADAMRFELRRAEELSALHARTEQVLEHVPSAILVVSPQMKVIAANRSLRERDPEAVAGRDVSQAFPAAPGADVARIRALLEQAVASGHLASLVAEPIAPFGAPGQFSLHAIPLESGPGESRAILVIDDLGAVAKMTAQLLRTEKLATVGVLAAGVAHEIGTPLGIVRTRAEIMLQKVGLVSAHAAGLEVIIDQVDRVARTIRQLLDFSRVEVTSICPTPLGPLSRSLLELLRFEVERRQLTMTMDVWDEAAEVSADPTLLQQALVNLLMNACDACAPGGRVRLSAAPDRSAELAENAWICIEVSDDGCGIPRAHQHQVFDPFFTTKKRGHGTGLGLTIAAQIARSHGAEIRLQSEPGRGTSVTLLWPAAAAHRPEERHAAS